MCQNGEFFQEINSLKNNLQVESKSKLVSLYPFLDVDGLIRVGGRIRHAPLEYSRKHPVILPSKHYLTKLIVRDVHYKNLHARPQAV